MQRLIRNVTFALTLAVASSAAHAIPLEDRDATTFDPNTGLEWLDVNAATFYSYDDVRAQLLGPSQPYEGFRYATAAEVQTLFQNAGITNFAPHGADPNILALIEMLGPTYLPGPGEGLVGLAGMTADESPLDSSYVLLMALVSGNDDGNDSYAGPDGFAPKFLQPPADGFGSFLVRQTVAEPLAVTATEFIANPIPPSLVLFAGGLGTIGFLAMRRKRRGN